MDLLQGQYSVPLNHWRLVYGAATYFVKVHGCNCKVPLNRSVFVVLKDHNSVSKSPVCHKKGQGATERACVPKKRKACVPKKRKVSVPKKRKVSVSKKRKVSVPKKRKVSVPKKRKVSVPMKRKASVLKKRKDFVTYNSCHRQGHESFDTLVVLLEPMPPAL